MINVFVVDRKEEKLNSCILRPASVLLILQSLRTLVSCLVAARHLSVVNVLRLEQPLAS